MAISRVLELAKGKAIELGKPPDRPPIAGQVSPKLPKPRVLKSDLPALRR